MARLGESVKGFEFRKDETWEDYDARTGPLLDKLFAESEKAEGIVGSIITYPVCDGKAAYLVTKESPLTLSHIPFGDAYMIPAAHVRGLTKRDVEAEVARNKALTRIFSEAKAREQAGKAVA
jgi:hypothetical protein